VGLAGSVLVPTSPECPGVAVRPVAPGFGDDGAAELSQQLRYGDGNQFEYAGAAVRGALPGGGHGEVRAGEQADRGPAVPGGPGGDLAAVEPADLLGQLMIFLDSPSRDRGGDQFRQRDRLAEIRDNLTARIAEAEREGWTGEVEGLKISLVGAQDKLAQIDRRAKTASTVDLGMPVFLQATSP
jgi:hypothetical protein